MKNNKSCIRISKAHERICNLRRMIPGYEEQIRQAKIDISSCISHGLVTSDYVPFEAYTFGTAIARLDEARFMVNSIGKEIRLLKKEISLENKKYDMSMRSESKKIDKTQLEKNYRDNLCRLNMRYRSGAISEREYNRLLEWERKNFESGGILYAERLAKALTPNPKWFR